MNRIQINPYLAPEPPNQERKPILKPLIKQVKRAAKVGTLLSAGSIAMSAPIAEYNDGKPISVSGFTQHVIDWTKKLAPIGYLSGSMLVFSDETKPTDPKETNSKT